MEIREKINTSNKKTTNMKLKKPIITNFLKENNLSPYEFCKNNTINYTIFNKLMIDEKIQKTTYISTIIKISVAINVNFFDLIEK